MKTYEKEKLVPFIEKRQYYKDMRTVFIAMSVIYIGMVIYAIYLKEWHDLFYMLNVWMLLVYGAIKNNELLQVSEFAILNIEDVRCKADIDILTSKHAWIKTEDHLPPEDESAGVGTGLSIDCLVITKEGESYCIVQAWYDYNGKCWNEKWDLHDTHIEGREVTHWMPIPKIEAL